MSLERIQGPSAVLTAGRHADGATVRQPVRDGPWVFAPADRYQRSRRACNVRKQPRALSGSNSRKDEYLAFLGHELRSPLGAIRNAVHTLGLVETRDPLQQKARAIIERQVAQMGRLVDDLMEVSRIATGKLQLRTERVAMSRIVENAVETALPMIDQGKQDLRVSLPAQPIWLCADAGRLEQVVVNLLVNAAKYTPVGGHIHLTVNRKGGEAVLRLRDTGVGIAPELLPRVFDLFTQEKRSMGASYGGLGIGLALVKQLVEMHRGRVDVESTLGQGTEFVVRLPVALSPAPPLHLTPAEAAALSARVIRNQVQPPSRPRREAGLGWIPDAWPDHETRRAVRSDEVVGLDPTIFA